jgi:hypothetical protein
MKRTQLAIPKASSRHRLPVFTMLILLLYSIEAMASGGPPAEKLVNIADTRTLAPGLSKWIADVYNTSHLDFGLIVVGIMALMGVVLGLICDKLVGLLGLNLGKMQHHE